MDISIDLLLNCGHTATVTFPEEYPEEVRKQILEDAKKADCLTCEPIEETKECWQCGVQVSEFFNSKIELNDVKIYYCLPCMETIAQEYTRLRLMQLEQEKQNSRRNISQGRILH